MQDEVCHLQIWIHTFNHHSSGKATSERKHNCEGNEQQAWRIYKTQNPVALKHPFHQQNQKNSKQNSTCLEIYLTYKTFRWIRKLDSSWKMCRIRSLIFVSGVARLIVRRSQFFGTYSGCILLVLTAITAVKQTIQPICLTPQSCDIHSSNILFNLCSKLSECFLSFSHIQLPLKTSVIHLKDFI